MFNNGNGFTGTNGDHRWWRAWKRERELDLAAYRRLAIQLHQGLPRAENVSRSVLVVTPNEARHWAKGCVTLACCMAEELCRPLLLVDAEAQSEVCGMLGSPESHGLTHFLTNVSPLLAELVLPTSQSNLYFLPSGSSRNSPLSASPENARALLVESRKYWDFTVIAGGPVLKNPLTLALAPHVGRVLLLVSENRTPIEDIDAAQIALDECQAKNVGLVLTELDEAVR
jgi:MinD-like ATPase involved in chromosome partitioning or flagellar assembly